MKLSAPAEGAAPEAGAAKGTAAGAAKGTAGATKRDAKEAAGSAAPPV